MSEQASLREQVAEAIRPHIWKKLDDHIGPGTRDARLTALRDADAALAAVSAHITEGLDELGYNKFSKQLMVAELEGLGLLPLPSPEQEQSGE